MSGKGNEAYEKFNREMGEKFADLYQRIIIDPPGSRFAQPAPALEFKPWVDEDQP